MLEFGLLDDGVKGRVHVKNLDVWFSNLYKFWYCKGLATMVVSGVTHMLTLAFTISFTFFLLTLVNWGSLSACRDEQSCHRSFGKYVRSDFLSQSSGQRGRDALGCAYLTVFGVYWMWSCFATVNSLRSAYEMSRFCSNELGLGERGIRSACWNEVVARLASLQIAGRAPWRSFHTAAAARRVAANSSSGEYQEEDVLSAHDVACRIMRKDNYLVAMLNAGILALELPLPSRIAGRYRLLDALAGRLKLTKTLEWSLQMCVLENLDSDARTLRRNFLAAGIVHVILAPFLAAFMSMRFFFMNAQEWRENKRYLGPRTWSPVARWAFRELNELPHIFEARLAASRPYADAYLKMFPNPLLSAVAGFVAFAAGSVVATLVALAAVLEGGDALLFHVHLGDRPLLWYFGVASLVFAVARSFQRNEEADEGGGRIGGRIPGATAAAERDGSSSPEGEFDRAMSKIAEHTHCFPEEWRGRCHTQDVSDAFSRAYRYKFWLFLDEIASVVLAPLVLCFSLPRCANDIVLFVEEHTVDVDGFGRLLHHSLFDFGRYGDPRYGGAKPGAQTIPTVSGKMEKSFLNFKLSYPEWDFDEANEVIDTVSSMLATGSEEEKNGDRLQSSRVKKRSKLAVSLEHLDEIAAASSSSSNGRPPPPPPGEGNLVSRHDIGQHETELV